MIIFFNLITLCINLILTMVIVNKFRRLDSLKREYLALQKNMEELLNENSYLSTLYLDDLEEKIATGKKLLSELAEKESSWEKAEVTFPNAHIESATNYNPITLEITQMLEQGKSISQIAEELDTTKGEVVLRLNLEKKSSAVKN